MRIMDHDLTSDRIPTRAIEESWKFQSTDTIESVHWTEIDLVSGRDGLEKTTESVDWYQLDIPVRDFLLSAPFPADDVVRIESMDDDVAFIFSDTPYVTVVGVVGLVDRVLPMIRFALVLHMEHFDLLLDALQYSYETIEYDPKTWCLRFKEWVYQSPRLPSW